MLHGESHVSRGPILLLGNKIYAPCHVSLNVRVTVKKKKTKYSITPRIVSLGRLCLKGWSFFKMTAVALGPKNLSRTRVQGG